MLNNKKILVLIVAYNAEMTILNLLERFSKKVLDSVDEILIADDSSKDLTSSIAMDYKKKNNLDKINIVKHKKNKGYGGNQKWGYNYAIKNNFDVVVMVHGDAQYPPEQILELIGPILSDKSDFVFGSRMAGDPLGGGMPFYKFVGNKFLTTMENLVLRTKLTEFHSGFRAYNVHALKEINFNLNSDDYHFDSEIIFQLVMANKKISEIVIPTKYGEEKCHVNSIKYGLNVLKSLAQFKLHNFGLKHYEKYDLPKTKKKP